MRHFDNPMIDPAWLTYFLERLLEPMLILPAAAAGLIGTAAHWAILGGAAVGAAFVLVTSRGAVPAAWIGACLAAMVWAMIVYRLRRLLNR
jgi:hypothetical protein